MNNLTCMENSTAATVHYSSTFIYGQVTVKIRPLWPFISTRGACTVCVCSSNSYYGDACTTVVI